MIFREIISPKKASNSHIQFARYTFVSVVALFVDLSLLFILTEYIGIFYIFSAIISFLIGLVVVYVVSVIWVFDTRSLKNLYMELGFFLGIGIVGLLVNVFLIWFLTSLFSLYYMFSKVIATMFVFLWNFFLRKYLIFNKKDE